MATDCRVSHGIPQHANQSLGYQGEVLATLVLGFSDADSASTFASDYLNSRRSTRKVVSKYWYLSSAHSGPGLSSTETRQRMMRVQYEGNDSVKLQTSPADGKLLGYTLCSGSKVRVLRDMKGLNTADVRGQEVWIPYSGHLYGEPVAINGAT